MGIDAAGNAVALWRRHDGSKYIVQAATRPAGGTWLAPVDLSLAGETAKEPRLAVDAAGDAVAVWTRFDGLDLTVQAAVRPAGGAWQAAARSLGGRRRTPKNRRSRSTPRPAPSQSGPGTTAADTWCRARGGSPGSGRKPDDVSVAGQNAEEPQVALDPAGNAIAVWSRFDGAKDIVQAAVEPGGGAWGAAGRPLRGRSERRGAAGRRRPRG